MGVRQLVILSHLLALGCAEAKPVFVTAPEWARDPELCGGTRHAIDPAVREHVVRLEQQLVASVLEDAPCAPEPAALELCSMTAELHRMLRQFPDAEMVFLFPEPVKLPQSRFQAHLGTSTATLQQANHAVFFLELSRVLMVGTSRKPALVANVFSGPTGTTPANVIWVWGGYGERCFVPQSDGHWAQYPLGTQAVSQQSRQAFSGPS
jgi:hypothetical protein